MSFEDWWRMCIQLGWREKTTAEYQAWKDREKLQEECNRLSLELERLKKT